MSKFIRLGVAVLTAVGLSSFSTAQIPSNAFGPLKPNPEWVAADGVLTHGADPATAALETRLHLGDTVTAFDFRAPPGAKAVVHIQGRYAVELTGNGEWQPVFLSFRAPRFDAGYTKFQNAYAPEVRVGADIRRNVLFTGASAGARWDSEDRGGPTLITVSGPFALRNVRYEVADFEPLVPPASSGGATNEKELVDLVATGRETFESVGCSACHLVEKDATGVTSGPNLFGLFQRDPRDREVVEGEGHRFRVKAGRDYLHRSLRQPAEQLAVAESGATRGAPYLPVMPAFAAETLSDLQIDAIGAYLATLNDPADRGPVVKLASQTGPTQVYDPMTDRLQWLVGDEVRMQRGPLAGVSGRSIHVGNPNGVHYTFDPRLLAIVKIWQGGFLDMTGELTNRGGRGLALGYDSRDIGFGAREYLLAPLNRAAEPIDFTFKEAKFGDFDTLKTLLGRNEDQLAQIAAVDAQFLGYSRDSRSKTAAPVFRYRVGRNTIEVATSIAEDGGVTIEVGGRLVDPQVFALNSALLQRAGASVGTLAGDRWTLPAGAKRARLTGRIGLGTHAWRPAASTASKRQRLITAPATAKLPAGYGIESYFPPKDNYGREQLFEALGLAVAKDGTVVVGTRTAGIWRLVKGEWRPFAEGLFDCLGVVVEDGKGLVVVAGQKAELTRISDTNGDGVADRYDTLFDAHSYHGNYHTYMHGPVRAADGSYYFALNLAHDGTNSTYNAGGAYMGTWGGFSGWAVRLKPDGRFELFANGLRSPASLGVGPDGRLWYADNQGEFVGTSKLFALERDKYYGHPSGLVDLPGMTPASPEIQWEKWMDRRERAAVLFPHNRVANSPGNPAWVPAKKAGPFAGQMLIGDQTQSNLLRVALQDVDGVAQGSVMPFFEGLESGVMRPVFLPDGSLLLGQTGRGWQAKGGKVASLQHVRWDGKTVAPAIVAMVATQKGFRLDLTQPLGGGIAEAALGAAIKLESWTYRDAPDYGSPELDLRAEMATMRIGKDRRSIYFDLASLEQPRVHPRQTARVYHVRLASAALFDANAPAEMHAYYSLYRFPANAP